MKSLAKYASLDALGTAAYVVIIASLMYFLGSGFLGQEKTIFAPIAMLMLFVFSAALTGSLVFGRPIIWYLDGKKKEALKLLFYTLAIFFVVTIVAFLLLIIILG